MRKKKNPDDIKMEEMNDGEEGGGEMREKREKKFGYENRTRHHEIFLQLFKRKKEK